MQLMSDDLSYPVAIFQFVYQKRTYHLQRDGQQPGGSQVPSAPSNAQSSASVFVNLNRPLQPEVENKFGQLVYQVPIHNKFITIYEITPIFR